MFHQRLPGSLEPKFQAPARSAPKSAALRPPAAALPSILQLQRTLGNGQVAQLMQRERAEASSEVAADPSVGKGAGSPLEPTIGSAMGAHFHADFSNVRVHSGGRVDGALADAGARAMTHGSDIFMRRDEYDPTSRRGRELIGHELAHVVQQSEGRASSLQAKADDGSARGRLEGDADKQGAAAADAAAAPFDWAQVDSDAFAAEIRRRETVGEPVPLGKTMAEARALPLAREIASRCLKNARVVPPAATGPVQHKKDWNTYPLSDGVYNQVEIDGLEGKWFVEQGAGSTASYSLGQHMGAITSGANSRRDGNFGVELPPQTWNYDSYKGAKWDLALQSKTGGTGTRTLSMDNNAFSNIEVSESFEVVDPGTATAGAFSGNVHALDQKIPIVLTGDKVTQKVSFAEAFKNTSGWSIGREIVDATTLTREMKFGFSAGFENAAKDKAGSELGISSANTSTIYSKISTLGGEAKTNARATEGEATLAGVKGKTIRKYVYPVYSVKNYTVTAYPHDPKTAEVTDRKLHSFAASSVALAKVETIDANDEGKVDSQHAPSPAQNADDARLAAEKAGKEVGAAGGVKVKITLEREIDAQKDFDNQDFSEVLTEGEKSRTVKKEWNTETVHQFNITNANGQKVAGTGGWSLGSEGKYAGIGAKISYGEVESKAGEFGDQVVNSGVNGKSQTVRVSQEVTGPTPGSGKDVQVVTMPLYRERVYAYAGYDEAGGKWSPLPIKARSKYYYAVGAITTKEVPPKTELKPEGHGKLDDTGTKDAAADAKSIKAKIDAEKDTGKKAALEKELEERLADNREALEDVVRRTHPSLVVIDRAKNIYEIELLVPVSDADKAAGQNTARKSKYRSTLEGLLDFTAPSVAAHNAADAMKTEDPAKAGVTLTSTPALGGTGAQGGVNPFPGDVDMAESIRIVAPTADAAANAMAAAIQATVTKATAPRPDGKLGYTFHGCMIGVLPADAKKPGAPVRFTPAQTMAGEMGYDKDAKYGGGKGTLTLAQAIASPAAGRSANTYWRGPIDEMGTYGEITKVLNYDAVRSGAEGEHLFGTPKVGQSFQEVGFGSEGRHDTERARLLEPLSRDIAKYAAEGNWVKAVKRAYTVARMLNDTTALNLFEPLLGSDVSQIKQLIDHIEMFANDVVNPRIDDKLRGGIGTAMSEAQAMTEATMLVARMSGIDEAKEFAPKMQHAIDVAAGKMTGNTKPYRVIEDEVIAPLEKKVKADAAFAKKAETALTVSGYLKGG